MNELRKLKNKALKNAEVKADYDALDDEFALIDVLLTMRNKAGLSQRELAEKMGTRRSNISRLENGHANPSWSTLQKYAEACGFHLGVIPIQR